MKANRVLLISFVFICLVLAITVPLSAQQPLASHRVSPPSPTPKQVTASPAQKLARQCREFLASGTELAVRFGSAKDDELTLLSNGAVDCSIKLPSVRLRQLAFGAYVLIGFEQQARATRINDEFWKGLLEEQQKENEAELEKQRATFVETAKFAAAIYKENEQRKEESLKLLAAFLEESQRNRELYGLLEEAGNLMKQALHSSPGMSLPAFVSVPAPQPIIIRTPPVPKALNCTTNTMDLALGGSTSWTNCWQH